MSRIFFDSMMFVYLLEDNPEFAPSVQHNLERCYERGDTLLTSCLAVGEMMAGGTKGGSNAEAARATILEMGFSPIPFDERCMALFGRLRSEFLLKAPDSIHLACAAAVGTDMFLTNDTQLLKRRLIVPGIQFIVDFTKPIL
ncbi:MAG: PIN domain-containing protein [Acidobacteriota bacterium]|nr:PIN domain-containing protein [Acidobacteriota bacterium]